MIPRKPLLLAGGLVFRGDGARPKKEDILLDGDQISIGTDLTIPANTRTITLDGLCVSPGWIDLHTHVFRSSGVFSVPPASIGVRAGVTTLVDAGSAGAFQYRSFFEDTIRTAEEAILAYVNVANTGIVHGHAGREGFVGDHFHPSVHDAKPALDLLAGFGSSIVGWKARLSAVLAGHDHDLEQHAFHRLCELRDKTALPVMVHHVKSTIPPDYLLERLERRDVYTHLYHGCEDTIFDHQTGRPSEAALRARDRGVVFDVGHGSGSFSWEYAEKACAEHGFWPDVISSDLHRYNTFWPVVDLATTMSKFLLLGASEEAVIAMVTGNVQRAIARPLGVFESGKATDLTIFAIEEGHFLMADSRGIERTADRRFLPITTIKAGEIYPCTAYPTSGVTTGAFAESIQNAAAY